MSEITLYLHIGATKTGSTALQRFLEQNFSKLQEHGVFYPNFVDQKVYSPMRPNVNYWQGCHFQNFDSSHDLDLFNRCIQYCKEKSLHSIVVSHEAFLLSWHDRIGLLANTLDANIKIICYVRRQDHYLEAAWKQVGHKFCASSEIMASLKNNIHQWGGWRPVSWYEKLEPWAKNFGEENLIVRPYEKQQMPTGIFSDFLNAMNITWPEEPTLKADTVHVNRGFSRDALEFLYLNKASYTGLGDHRLYNMLETLLTDDYKKQPFETYGILSPQERIELLNEFEESNQMVAKKYLHRPDGRLFYEPWPNANDAWEPYEGLTVETLTPIVTSMIYTLYMKQAFLAKKEQALEENLSKLRLEDGLLPKIKRWLNRITTRQSN